MAEPILEKEIVEWTILIERNLNGKYVATIEGRWLIPDPPKLVENYPKPTVIGEVFGTLDGASVAANKRIDVLEGTIRQNIYKSVAKETRTMYV